MCNYGYNYMCKEIKKKDSKLKRNIIFVQQKQCFIRVNVRLILSNNQIIYHRIENEAFEQ